MSNNNLCFKRVVSGWGRLKNWALKFFFYTHHKKSLKNFILKYPSDPSDKKLDEYPKEKLICKTNFSQAYHYLRRPRFYQVLKHFLRFFYDFFRIFLK